MNVMRWGVSAVAALLLAGGSSFAGNTDELNAMKATMDNMKQEMEAMRTTMASEREAMRANAGGAPESLKSANGKATVKIGGRFETVYDISWESGYNPSDANDNSRYTRSSWDVYRAELNFTIDFTPDTKAYIVLRPDRGSAEVGQLLDEMWWQWSNIGGTGLAAKVGIQTLDLGMFNGSKSPWQRVMIWDPYVQSAMQNNAFNAGRENSANYHASDIDAIGVTLSYKWDQVKVSAGIYGQTIGGDDNDQETDAGVTTSGDYRNIGFENHYVTAHFDPCWMEKLHMQASYFGQFDNGEGSTGYFNTAANQIYAYRAMGSTRDANTDNRRGSTYIPGFDFGFSYVSDCWAVYGEMVVIANPNYYRDAYSLAFSSGADYSLTEKLKVGGAFEWKQYDQSRYLTGGSDVAQYGMRASLGANYDFGNGIYLKAQYSHHWLYTYGIGNNNCKDNDQISFLTGCRF